MTNTAAGHKTKSAHDIHLGAAPLHFKRILFATDFSPQASAAFKTAVRLSQNYGSMLYLAHVVSPMLYAPNGGVVAPALQQAEIESAHEKLGHHITRMPEPGAIKYQQIVTCGMAKELIPAIVKENHIDLLAMGSHGRDGVSKLALGSVAEAALRHVHCPVLVCGPHCRRTYHPFKSILLATDLSLESLRSAQFASALSEEFHSQLTIAHVIRNQPAREDRDQGFAKIKELVPEDTGLQKHIRFSIHSGDPASELLGVAERTNADLIVMGVHETGFAADHAPWSTISSVIREARCPVMAVQPHFG